MKRAKSVRDFDFYIDEYMYNCQSRKLRKKTLQTYEQTLRLFERWCLDAMGITSPEEIRESIFRRYICDLQERGKYTFYSVEEAAIGYTPNKRRDYGRPISVTAINNYIRNLKAFFEWYARYTSQPNPVSAVRELFNRGVRVHILNMGLVENTLTGNLILTVMLAFAEYERGMIVERTQTGKAVARQDPNFREGRPKKYPKCQLHHAAELLDSAKSYKQVRL